DRTASRPGTSSAWAAAAACPRRYREPAARLPYHWGARGRTFLALSRRSDSQYTDFPSSPDRGAAELAVTPRGFAHSPEHVRTARRFDIGDDEVLDVPPAAHDDFAAGIHDVAVAVADTPPALGAALRGIERDVVAAHEPSAVLDRTRGVIGAHFHEMREHSVGADDVEVRREDDPRAFPRDDARRLDVAAVRANDDAELHAAPLKNRERAALLVKLLVGGALAVNAEQVPAVRDQRGVVEIGAAQFVKADDECR